MPFGSSNSTLGVKFLTNPQVIEEVAEADEEVVVTEVVDEEDSEEVDEEVVEVDSVVVIEEVEVDLPAEEVIEEGVVETEDEVVSNAHLHKMSRADIRPRWWTRSTPRWSWSRWKARTRWTRTRCRHP